MVMETAATDPASKLAWHKFQTVWQLAGVSATTCFVLEYTRPGRALNRRIAALLAIPPAFVLAIIVFGQDALLWRQLTVVDGVVVAENARPAQFLIGYGLGLVIVNTVAFLGLFVRSPQHRWPIALMVFGEIASRILWLAGLPRGSRVDAELLAIVLVWSTYAIAVFGFRILDPLGAARLTVIRQMREGMVVFDNNWRAVSLNPAAEQILGARPGQWRDRSWEQLLPAAGPPPDANAADSPAPSEITLGAGDDLRSYAIDLSPLMDQRGLRAGSLLLLLDTTEQRRAQAQAQAQQRTLAVLTERERLARELHDSAGQVLAFVNTQGQAVRRVLARGEVELADEYLARLIEVVREADTDLRESILGLRVTLAGQGLARALAAYLGQYQRRYGILADLTCDDPLEDIALEPFVEAQLLRIAQEALANARKHSAARSAHVTLRCADGFVTVEIRDDGCGFDPEELRERGEGLGLRVMRERAQDIRGVIVVRSARGEGTTVTVTAPAGAAVGGAPPVGAASGRGAAPQGKGSAGETKHARIAG
jgi:signal transduction histidine kinase